MAKQVMDIRHTKTFSCIESDEQQRRWGEKEWNTAIEKGNYDLTRERLNFEIVKGMTIQPIDKRLSIPEKFAKNLRDRGIIDPNSRHPDTPMYNTYVNFLFEGDRDRMRELAFGNQEINWEKGKDNSHIMRMPEIEKWAKDMYKFVADRYGEENIVCFYVHLDETTPHIHCTLVPVIDNEVSFKRAFAGKDKYEYSDRVTKLHDELAEINKKWGLERGDSIKVTGARHRSTEEYRRDLARQCSDAENTLHGYNTTLNDLSREIGLATRRCKGLQTMVSNLEKEQELLMTKVKNIGQLKGLQDEQFIAAKRQLEEVEAKLDDKRSKLATAERQLEELRSARENLVAELDGLKQSETLAKERVYNLNLQLARTASDNQGLAVSNVTAAFFDDIIKDFGIRSNASPELREAGSETLISQMVERSTDMITVAGLLYLGLPVQAVAYADSHGGGGGGGGSDLPWGRDPKEDDREWARRCAQEAKRMMRPAVSRGIKRG